jgi:hypothetical protein
VALEYHTGWWVDAQRLSTVPRVIEWHGARTTFVIERAYGMRIYAEIGGQPVDFCDRIDTS